jgi:hypothetical protein
MSSRGWTISQRLETGEIERRSRWSGCLPYGSVEEVAAPEYLAAQLCLLPISSGPRRTFIRERLSAWSRAFLDARLATWSGESGARSMLSAAAALAHREMADADGLASR